MFSLRRYKLHPLYLITSIIFLFFLKFEIAKAQGSELVTLPFGAHVINVDGQIDGEQPVRTYLPLQLLPQTILSGTVIDVSNNAVTIEPFGRQASQPPDRPLYLQVTNGEKKGFLVDIVERQDNTFICSQDLSQWIELGDSLIVRQHIFLSEFLGENNRFNLGDGTDADLTDNLVIHDPELGRERIYYFHSTRNRWEEKGVASDASQALIRYPYAPYIVRRSPGTLRIMIVGQVAANSVLLPLETGSRIFSLPGHVNPTLANWISPEGEFSPLTGANTSSADIFTLYSASSPDPRGSFYLRSAPSEDQWREIGINNSAQAEQPLDFLSALKVTTKRSSGFLLVEAEAEPFATAPASPPPLPPDPSPNEVDLFATLEFGFLSLPPDLSHVLERSADLVNWTQIGPGIFFDPGTPIEFTVPLPAGQSRNFYRLVITSPF